jgi:GntR family transcriptional regulator
LIEAVADNSAPPPLVLRLPDMLEHLALQSDGSVPLHTQLEQALRALLQTPKVGPGTVLPGEMELVQALGVSRHTVRHALSALVADGLLRRTRGSGTIVAARTPAPLIERSLSSFYAFAWEVRSRGAEHRSEVLERHPLPAPQAIADRLDVEPGSPVERIVRLRHADEEPLILETAYMPADLGALLNTAALTHEAIYDVLERVAGLRVTRAQEQIRPVLLDRRSASLLGVRAGSPAFQVDRTTWWDERRLEWQRSLVRGDRYLYSVDLPAPRDRQRT